MAQYKTVYTIQDLDFEDTMTILFGLRARLDEAEKIIQRDDESENFKLSAESRQYWLDDIAQTTSVLKRWESIRKWNVVEDVPATDCPSEQESAEVVL